MKLSSDTLNVLKNFATINPGIFIKKGNTLKTISRENNILAEAGLSTDEFPVDFGINDLNEFLSVLSLTKTPTLEFDKNNILVDCGRSVIKYRFAAKEVLHLPPDKPVRFDVVDTSFTCTKEDLAWILQTASVLQSPHICLQSTGKVVTATSFDATNDAAHSNSIDIGDSDSKTFKLIFKTANLLMIPGTYLISASGPVVHFKNMDQNIQYWIAAEVGSAVEA